MSLIVEAEINTDGTVQLLEPIRVYRKTRATVTISEDAAVAVDERRKGNSAALLQHLKDNPSRTKRSVEEIEEHVRSVRQLRDEWD